MKLYELVKVSHNKNFDSEISVNFKGFTFEFKASEFETFAGYEVLKDSEIILVRAFTDDIIVVYAK